MKDARKRSNAKPPTPQPVKTHTGWIRDTERAMRASDFDPMAKLLFSEMIDHTSEDKRTCWAANGTMAVRLHMSVPTVAKYVKQLEARNAIRWLGKGPKGTIKYEILDDWANLALDAMTIRLDKHKEAITARQAKSRAQRKQSVTQTVFRPEVDLSRNDAFDLSHKNGFDEHLQQTPSRISSEEGTNAYARAKGRA